jgi:predicted ribosomally synthesized peptide with nif11-like leader
MLNILNKLVQNAQLQEKIKAATDQATVMELLILAGAEKGYAFTIESINQFLSELNSIPHEMSEEDLLGVSGGYPPTSIMCETHFRCTANNWCR